MNILILGSGGREHALAWAVSQNPKCDKLIVAPGNPGCAEVAECLDLDILDGAAVVELCDEHSISFVIVGPEAPLAAGVANDLRRAGILTFGPSKDAAQLEASKAFTKEICDACAAPTAAYARFDQLAPALEYVHHKGAPIVIKADGLAAGKGVFVAMDIEQAIAGLEAVFDGSFGDAGSEVVIEEFMEGEEASFFVLSDGENLLPIGTAQDHKRAYDGDKGPNTGGMGAYSPAPVMSQSVIDKTMAEIVAPSMRVMKERGMPYQGVLFVGLMIKDGQPRLVEYNARFGDPECQVLMLRLGAQALDAMLACAEGRLDQMHLNWAEDHALTVVMAAKGYPGTYEKGSIISGLEDADSADVVVFHAGTALEEGVLQANGGRVLAVTARATDLKGAHKQAYDALNKINWAGGFYRKDIGWRAL